MFACTRGPLLVVLGTLLACSSARGSDDAAEERAALKAVQDKLKSVKTNDRAEALKRLREMPGPESIKLIFDRGLRDKQPDVRNAALDTLFSYKNDAALCDELLAYARPESGKRPAPGDVPAALAILYSSELPEVQAASLALLESQLAAPPLAQRFLEDLSGVWARNASGESLAQLVRLIKSEIVASRFAFHRSLIQSLVRFQDAEAIEALIDLLDTAKGEVRLDIVRHLRGVTGQQLGAEAESWRGWWRQNKPTYRVPARYTLPSIDSLADGGAPLYYGLPLYAQRIVFVLDTSGSMAGLRMEAAKAELHKAVEALPASTAFGIVVFNSAVGVWQKQLMPATPEAKRAAHQFVASQVATAQTNTYDALETAMRFDAEAIYFLSDGIPTTGKIVRPDGIVAAVTRANQGRMISLYTIGVGDEVRGQSGLFLKQIAEQNFGAYRSLR